MSKANAKQQLAMKEGKDLPMPARRPTYPLAPTAKLFKELLRVPIFHWVSQTGLIPWPQDYEERAYKRGLKTADTILKKSPENGGKSFPGRQHRALN